MREVGIKDYHAHVYYDARTRRTAARLRLAIEKRFRVEMGRWRDEPVGPHPQSMYQVKFGRREFARIVPWLMLNRADLPILIHPNTGNAYEDHAVNAIWMGKPRRLRLACLMPHKAKAGARPLRPVRRGGSGE
jgi:aromatic ring-cleaving dioxygenase